MGDFNKMEKILVVDPEKCTGCRLCESVCSLFHTGICNPSLSSIRIIKYEEEGIDMPTVCQQCEESICLLSCPVNAISKDEKTGALITNEERCIKCKTCLVVCPFGGATMDPDRKIIRCDLCGGSPTCVYFCQTKAISYAEVEKINMQLKRDRIKKIVKLNIISHDN